jgi:hypothetical protein
MILLTECAGGRAFLSVGGDSNGKILRIRKVFRVKCLLEQKIGKFSGLTTRLFLYNNRGTLAAFPTVACRTDPTLRQSLDVAD